MYIEIGAMPMPANFPYAHVLKKGRPQHGIPGRMNTYDAFYVKHPPMENSRRAKIFAPFDALRGFSEAVASKRVLYEERRELTEREREELDREMSFLQELSDSRRRAGEQPVSVCVTYYEPCEDPENEAFGKKGIYRTITGALGKADPLCRRISLDGASIPVEAVLRIEHSSDHSLDQRCFHCLPC